MLVEPRSIKHRSGTGPRDAVLSENGSPAPLRMLLERRSGSQFIDVLFSDLVALGLEEGQAHSILFDVLNWPTLAVRNAERDKGTVKVLQAVALETPTSSFGRGLAWVTATIATGKPPEVGAAQCDVTAVDWDSGDDEMNALMVLMEGWQQEYEVRPINHRPPEAPDTWAWLGDPRAKLYRNVPVDWEHRVRRIGTVLGMKTFVAATPQEAAAQSLHDAARFAVLMKGTANWGAVTDNFNAAEHPVLDVGNPGTDFALLLDAVRPLVAKYVMGCSIPDGPAPRALSAGEVIYHRKISPQPRIFDRFDAGSSQPCPHGVAFVPNDGDKAIKGMQRRYSNFEPSMLFHCSKFPNCGMYVVKS